MMTYYKNKNFTTTIEHVKYLKNIERMSNSKIIHVLKEYWNCDAFTATTILNYYDVIKEKEVGKDE